MIRMKGYPPGKSSVSSDAASPPSGQRRGSFRDPVEVEAACSHIRGVLIARLDDVYETRILPLLLRLRIAEWEAVEVFQEIQLAFFPEEFAEDTDIAETMAQERAGRLCGLIPRPTTGHLNRCGSERLILMARKLGWV